MATAVACWERFAAPRRASATARPLPWRRPMPRPAWTASPPAAGQRRWRRVRSLHRAARRRARRRRAVLRLRVRPRGGAVLTRGGYGPVLEGSRVRVEPIGEERALALLAGTPEPTLGWEDGFPLEPLLDF